MSTRPTAFPVGGELSVAAYVAEFLVSAGVRRVYGLPGGHIQPLWDRCARAGLQIIDARAEGAAVHMAQAEAELDGVLGVAMVTAGPGFTNTITALANANASRAPVLVLSGRPPRPQTGIGALQDLQQQTLAASLCRMAVSVWHRRQVLPTLQMAMVAARGGDVPPGPVYVDFPLDLLNEDLDAADRGADWQAPSPPGVRAPDPGVVARAAALIRDARRPVVLSGGRLTDVDGGALVDLLDATGALHLDTVESRGVVPRRHPSSVPGARGTALAGADLLITIGRRLDFQLAYGSRAVLPGRLLRIGRSWDQLLDNRAGDVELQADVGLALRALVAAGAGSDHLDGEWLDAMRDRHRERSAELLTQLASDEVDNEGRMHPYRLIGEINRVIDGDSIVAVDGGDILSFARVGLEAGRMLDPGPFGCLGVGAPYAVAAALAHPDARVVCLSGDGSFGFNAMEVSTAARHDASVLFVVANNAAWNIDRYDQLSRYDNVVGVDLPGCRYDVLGEALGAHGYRVEEHSELRPTLEKALQTLPAVVDVAVSRNAVSPDARSGLAAVPDWQALEAWDIAERRDRGLP